MGETYRGAGVDDRAGRDAVAAIRDLVRSTFRPEVIGDHDGIGGLFEFDARRLRRPVLVASTDGVGTKVRVAQAAGRFATIGIDLVAMVVDDLVCRGAEPLFVLDYLAVGRLDAEQVSQIVEGVAEGCRTAGCSLVGGELSQHPGSLAPGEFDLVGTAVGVVDRDAIVTGEHVAEGDVVLGLPSGNLRANGYALVRRVLLEVAGRSLTDPAWSGARHSLADELLAPSVIYAPAMLALLRAVDVRAAAHVTGGGLHRALERLARPRLDVVADRAAWEVPPIFAEVQSVGGVDDAEMAAVFNLGIGLVVVVPARDRLRAIDVLRSHGHRAVEIGEVVAGAGAARLTGPA